jgi:hypothetical protein
MSFSKKNRVKRSVVRPRNERKEESDNEDEDIEEKGNKQKENEKENDLEENDQEIKKQSFKDKIAQFFTFTKTKTTYTFADTGGKDVQDDEIDTFNKGGVEVDDDLTEYHIKNANEFMKLMKKEEEVVIAKEVEKVEEKIEKTSYDLFKEYLNVVNDNSKVREVFCKKDFENEIKPLIERYTSEFNFSSPLLKLIYLR